MAKIKTKFICQECGYESPKWMGKCPGCNSWNTFTEEIINKETKKNSRGISSNKVLRLKDIEVKEEKRITTKYMELDRVLGGGIVNSSLVLVGGDPGIGKSTLLMQTGDKVAGQGLKVLYVTGEESARQIKIRAERLEMESDNMYILAETNMDHILKNINELEPDLLILDSIQTIYNPDITSAPGSVSQVKEITSTIMRTTKSTNMSTFIVGHVTKQGSIAGPRVLEHMVDTVLYFEGDTQHSYRILRAVKNRYGSTNEVGVFEMRDSGLEEIINPSSFFLESRTENSYGSVITASMEGTRPLLLEI
ncbi:MAG: DNA repair protein RadA, partial [Tissierellales bacterium]|nr:DNA repair protein RadA [Tissierellales bacterium]